MTVQSGQTTDPIGLIVMCLRAIADLPRPARRLIALLVDLAVCVFSVWLAFSIRIGEWTLLSPQVLKVLAVVLPCWLGAAWLFGIYQSIIRSTGGRSMVDLAMACMTIALVTMTLFLFIGVDGIPRTIGVLQPMILLLLLATSRIVTRYALTDVLHVAGRGQEHRVAIYGAGRAGQQLGHALRHERHLNLVCYFDDDDSLAGARVDGVKIYSASQLTDRIERHDIQEVLLALPSVRKTRRREIVEQIGQQKIRVRSLPSIGNIIDGAVSIKDLKEVRVEDLLGRDPVPPDESLLRGAITDKQVLVSGAGGSIGSEICRQVMARAPHSIVLVEHSEFALYSILSELEERYPDAKIIPELLDVSDGPALRRVMERHRPQTVFHAAAYKHVPLVEANPISGLRNNVFGTYHCCLEAERVGANRFILVSTDKAVRPTNIMGASKRICELVLQARAERKGTDTIFSIVRFGNVLSSSGSVVPRFQAQINAGGPVTLTHADVTRYFMTIPEAAQLVMQAGAMAIGGEVFVLDMGQPVRILNLAKSMIQLSGCSVRDAQNPDGDIEIHEVGLRPGEKMYEELLIGDNPMPTAHFRIMQAREKMIAWSALDRSLQTLSTALADGNAPAALRILRELVTDYQPAEQIETIDPAAIGMGGEERGAMAG